MASREEFSAFIRSESGEGKNSGYGATQDWDKLWTKQAQAGGGSLSRSMPPQSPKSGEQAPLLVPPVPQSTLPPSSRRRHMRSNSECLVAVPQSGILNAPIRSSSRPPRASMSQVKSVVSLHSSGGASSGGASTASTGSANRTRLHRRAKSDIPNAIFSSGNSVGGRREITKSDLLKSFPNPRWGGATPGKNPLSHTRQRSRTGSDGFDEIRSVASGGATSYGAIAPDPDGGAANGGPGHRGHPLLQSIGSVELPPDMRARHVRGVSDASAEGVTTNLAKSALFKGVTDTGRIQMHLPKDSFRILMDSQLEAGMVYKRKLVDDEDGFFVDFHTVDDGDDAMVELEEGQKRLPPDLYVMAVDSTIYRRMLDEVIRSKTMPCGTFFCGHHEDIKHPDITIAALIVGLVMFLLLAGSMMYA